ncbi:diguanylate cyclase/phosphodiesterase [Thermodesulfobium acidiphilum]|uniref:Diguanylate cyclase/phosphodiesterase n=1 Tax=Thermodesulfobium acidiphilum TaxID=1794699 RepID=A0A2R4W200_THEAF|nr:GGDEF domain-containing protein [Thermodesulfobium acidiphilum]AWB10827.1 diguanylate cyclase/phosphodiesterase [Thermodesulfobium acidiphilum]
MKNLLKKIIENKDFTTLFQPIFSLSNGIVVGYEALTRGPENTIFYNPEKLFESAKTENLLWEMELYTRLSAIEKFYSFKSDKILFLNVDPDIIRDKKFTKGTTKHLFENIINTSNIVFEITEKTAIKDYVEFKEIIQNYKTQGYKIAIDDVGSGHSGLTTISEVRPNYIKIDMFLIRDIDKNNFKKSIVKALVELANDLDLKLIAEGIETLDELKTVIELGIPLAQGFLLGRPSKELLEMNLTLKDFIKETKSSLEMRKFKSACEINIGKLARRDNAVQFSTLSIDIEKIFLNNFRLHGIAVLNGEKVIGLITKRNFFTQLGTRFGRELYLEKPIEKIMDIEPLVVDYFTPISEVIKRIANREEHKLYDYVIVERDEKYFGVVPIINLLEKSMELELNIAKYSNPLTGLPGNLIIEEKIRESINNKIPFSLIYFDLNNFKSFNDYYGFERGDRVIKYIANILERHMDFYKDSFLGHVGGDDFIAIVKSYEIEKLCYNIIEEFDFNIKRFYNEEDIKQGYITSIDRDGTKKHFPIISISISSVNNRNFLNYEKVIERISEIKKLCKELCKKFKKSYFLMEEEVLAKEKNEKTLANNF